MSANAEVFASLLQQPELPDEQRAALLWALRQAAEEDARGPMYRPHVDLALSRIEDAIRAEHSLRACEILLRETRSSAGQLIRDLCAVVLEQAPDTDR